MGFGASKPSLEEQLKENKREISKSVRELDRERAKLEAEEKRLIHDIRQAAQKGEMTSTKIMARDLVRTRKHVRKFYEMRSQLQAVGLRLQTVKSTQAMAESMKGVGKIMVNMNEQLDIPALQKVMTNFMRESEKLGLTEDVMNDAVDDAMGEADDEEEEELVIRQVLDEIGIDLSGQLLEAPARVTGPQSSTISSQQQKTAEPIAAGDGPQFLGQSIPHLDQEHETTRSPPKGLDALEKSVQERLKNLKA